MPPIDLIERTKSQSRTVLNEAESKLLLASYGVPVVEEILAYTPVEAVENARMIGFPVVLKGVGTALIHKTERGVVRTGLINAEEVRQAAIKIEEAAGTDLEGWLVQPQINGPREFIAGMFQDDQFGPVIMFGLGGVFTEALGDVVFRVTPLDEIQANQMLDQIRSRNLLNAFRGEPAVNREGLIATLMGLSRLCEEHPDVTEVDINPLLITPKGQPIAVDALVVLGEAKTRAPLKPAQDPSAVLSLFHPKSIAFIGATSQFRKWGQLLFTNVIAGGYEGDVYLVNPNADAIAGRPVYKSVVDIPGPVDLAVVTVPAAKVFNLLPEFRAKGISGMILISSGFGETGPEGRRLEEGLVAEARKNGILILGPNTMGICNPHQKFYCMGSPVRPKPGSTTFISQSGNLGAQLLFYAEQQGIGIRAFVGSGNEIMLTVEDALDTFAKDNLTGTILLYIESLKNGRRFFESARRVGREKPIVVLKGGRTQAGGRAAASHTGALASNIRVFEAACLQAGILLVNQPMDLMDLSAGFSSLPLPRGRRVAIMTMFGGWGVILADLCQEYGLEVPELPSELIDRINHWLPSFWSHSNPVDLVFDSDPGVPLKILKELLKWNGCDTVVFIGIIGRASVLSRVIESTVLTDPEADRVYLDSIKKNLIDYDSYLINQIVSLMEEFGKPVVGVSMITDEHKRTVLDDGGRRYKGVFFQTPERAIKALAKMCDYRDWLNR